MKAKKHLSVLLMSFLLCLCACGKSDAKTELITPSPTETVAIPSIPELPEGEQIYAHIDVQDYGSITVLLRPDCAPITVDNFVKIAETGFYDGLTFHRIISGFMIQGGDPFGNGTGGLQEKIKGEFADNGIENPLPHKRGTISMCRGGRDYDSASCQFFIVHQDYPSLDGYYASFGYVTEGIEVVDAIVADAHPIDGNGSISPEDQPVINSITIERK